MQNVATSALVACAVAAAAAAARDDDELAAALELTARAEARRIAVVERASAATVCIFDALRRGGGSGVLIDADGYGLTNFHVVAAMLGDRRGFGGLSDGRLYRLEVLGIDPGGDVAMFRLTGRDAFPFAPLGDSDAVSAGDAVIAAGNPFVLAEDYTPTVTTGIVTGVHRYQWGQGNQLIYSDCIQTDAPINPGNSGGPLFDDKGHIIGINGRISVNARGRFNVGVGYAISINQIRRFMPGLRAGLLVEHGTLQATVDDMAGRVVFDRLLEDAPAWNAGIRPGDELLRFAGHAIASRNHFASVLGTYPANWPVTVVFRREVQIQAAVTRLEPVSAGLEAPWEVSRRDNLKAVRRVGKAFLAATRPGEDDVSASSWGALVERVALPVDPAAAPDEETFSFTWTTGQPARLEATDGGERRDRIEFTVDAAFQRLVGLEGQRPLPAERQWALGAMYLSVAQFFDVALHLDWTRFRHAGADALVANPPVDAVIPPSVLEVLEHPIGDHADAALEYGADDFLLRRMIVTDRPTGARVVVDVSDYRDVGGRLFPHLFEVRSAGGAYKLVFSQVRPQP